MSLRRRILKIFLIVVVLALLAGYGAFTTFFFNPFEGAYEGDVSSLIPRDVDFYAAKADLADDFAPLPLPAFAEEFAASRGGQAVMRLSAYQELMEGLGVEEALARLEESLAQLPVEVDLLEVFGGRDLAVAGYLKGPDLAAADWAAYGRANWMGKLGIELLDTGFLDLESQGLVQEVVLDDAGDTVGIGLSGGQLPRQLYLTRILDVIVVSTTPQLVRQTHAFDAGRGEDSFGLSAKYGDNIGLREREGNELEIYADFRAVSKSLELPAQLPNPNSDRFVQAFLGKLFQLSSVRELIGIVSFGNGLTLDAHGALSSELMNPVQKRLYRQRGFDKARAQALAGMVPSDAGLFLYMHGDVGDLLRTAMGSAEEALITNLEDPVRSVWGYADINPLVDDLDAALEDRFALVLRNNDYEDEGESGPPHDDTPVPAWALILWKDDSEALDEIVTRIQNRQGEFAIQGRTPGSRGVYENTVAGGHKVYEYWNPFVPGTGHIATLEIPVPGASDTYFIVSNTHQMLGAMAKTLYEGGQRYPRLSEDNWFVSLVNAGLPSADFLAWLNPRAMGETNRALAGLQAELELLSAIDWRVERPRIEKKVVKEHFPDERWGSISPDNRAEYDMIVQQELDAFERQFNAQHAGTLRERYVRELEAVEILQALLIELSIDQKAFDVHVRAVVPLDAADAPDA